MELITVTNGSFNPKDLCCAVSSATSAAGLTAKYNWIKERQKEGLVFRKTSNAGKSGKVFIEYIPTEYAWTPIIAKDCMHINCLWVSGRFAGHGYAKILLESCIADTSNKQMSGITALCTVKKSPYMHSSSFYAHMGFEISDEFNGYLLMLKKFKHNASASFSPALNNTEKVNKEGLHIFYTNQCPFTEYYVNTIALQKASIEFIPYQITKISTLEEAKNACIPWTTYGAFYNGIYIGHEIIGSANFNKKTGIPNK